MRGICVRPPSQARLTPCQLSHRESQARPVCHCEERSDAAIRLASPTKRRSFLKLVVYFYL